MLPMFPVYAHPIPIYQHMKFHTYWVLILSTKWKLLTVSQHLHKVYNNNNGTQKVTLDICRQYFKCQISRHRGEDPEDSDLQAKKQSSAISITFKFCSPQRTVGSVSCFFLRLALTDYSPSPKFTFNYEHLWKNSMWFDPHCYKHSQIIQQIHKICL